MPTRVGIEISPDACRIVEIEQARNRAASRDRAAGWARRAAAGLERRTADRATGRAAKGGGRSEAGAGAARRSAETRAGASAVRWGARDDFVFSDRKLAVIDGRIVQPGDDVRGARVVEITPTAVLLRDAAVHRPRWWG